MLQAKHNDLIKFMIVHRRRLFTPLPRLDIGISQVKQAYNTI